MSLRRKTQMKRTGGLKRSAMPPRQAWIKKPSKRSQIPPEVRARVAARSHGRCEWILIARDGYRECFDRAEHMHHRKLRSSGGAHTLANLLHVCRRHHDYIHDHPALAFDQGWLVHAWEAS